jgi:hypothetical protein
MSSDIFRFKRFWKTVNNYLAFLFPNNYGVIQKCFVIKSCETANSWLGIIRRTGDKER